MPRKPAPSITFKLEVTADDTPVRGNAMASGDAAADRQVEDEILARLARGDVWAWCVVTVIAQVKGVRGRAVMGACCYRDEAEFRACSYADLKSEAIADLRANLEARVQSGCEAAEIISALDEAAIMETRPNH